MKTRIVQKQFKRKESKYIIDKETFALFEMELSQHMVADQFAKSTISNIYFDNDNFDMIQDAIAKKNGREKVRMRVYDAKPTAKSQAFLEIKKKVQGVGYKYRLTSNPIAVANYIERGLSDATISDAKVTSELQDLKKRYGQITPKMYIYYDRLSFKGKEDKKLRVTLDQNLIFRDYDVTLLHGKYGYPLLPANLMIMEIKVPEERPAWLDALLEKYQVEKQSFSKYANAYRLSQEKKESEIFADRYIF